MVSFVAPGGGWPLGPQAVQAPYLKHCYCYLIGVCAAVDPRNSLRARDALHPSVILAPASGPAIAAKNASATIPIVTPALGDAVHLGLIASDSRPGGNVTGITPYVAGLPAKQMELAREVVSGAARVGVLANLSDPKAPPQWEELAAAGRELGVSVVVADAPTPDDLERAFQVLASQRTDVVIVLETSMLLSERKRIAARAATTRLPAIYGYREHVDDGGLISYGVDLRACFRRGGYYVYRIDLERRRATRSAGRVPHQARAGHQSQNREDARHHDAAAAAGPRR
jgi:ABC-type uncharacterized transport system substrate-binding protein